MNNVEIAFTFDKRIIRGAAVSIKSLLETAKDSTAYLIHIFHSDLTTPICNAFTSMARGTRHKMLFHKIDASIFDGMPKGRGSWTEIVYYRFLIPEILKDSPKAIYSDVDVFFRDDMSEIFSTDISDYEVGAVRAEVNSPEATGHKYFPENRRDYIFWSGFLLLNCELMRKKNFFDRIKKSAKENAHRLRLWDLDAMNLAAESIFPLPFRYVTLESIFETKNLADAPEYRFLKNVYSDIELLNAKENPAIIHYAGPLGKPWQRIGNPEYYMNCDAKIPNLLRRSTFRDFRKRLFSKKDFRSAVNALSHSK